MPLGQEHSGWRVEQSKVGDYTGTARAGLLEAAEAGETHWAGVVHMY